ncbi:MULTISPECIES: DUF6250 domain-containing protein [unclassified Azospirillum]|uniref:DUF6250 domain-containing protein n=1 Tax=unclassified Azospirillum TaxID=2630922 RepID=UPI000B62CBE9|nr:MULTISPECIES: DUF6250 domain-containing protein [unclassified Azospirillum]SNS39027.1 hypothetical protein SAMN05880556_104210 [Azospirillum sp. RU38E]SNS57415.1 hypothetical protein SAMN05880591_104210 [Azospirillum sp. RU37A]
MGFALNRRAFLHLALSTGITAAAPVGAAAPSPTYRPGPLLFSDDFTQGLGQWQVEMHRPGRMVAQAGVMEIDVPAGTSVWFRHPLSGPVLIEYEAQAVSEGGPNDRVSDLNAFWMATDPAAPGGDVLARTRSGKFEDYDTLKTYYVGQGGNWNKTTRFRRYIGRQDDRPLLPENDRQDPADMLVPNRWQKITLLAAGPTVRYFRDEKMLFDYNDPEPYTRGHFAIRTTQSHLRIRRFRVYQAVAG